MKLVYNENESNLNSNKSFLKQLILQKQISHIYPQYEIHYMNLQIKLVINQ